MICPRCGSDVPGAASECSSCGMPAAFMGGGDRLAASGPVLEPEVLESLDEVDGPGPRRPGGGQFRVQPTGCTLGPGCGCLGLPLLAIAGVLVSAVIALLWVLSLGRVPASLLRLAKQARRGFTST